MSFQDHDHNDLNEVQDLMGSCECSEEYAVRLLGQCSNNLEEAKLRHDIEKLYGVPTAPRQAKEQPPTQKYDFDNISSESSDDDMKSVRQAPSEEQPNRQRIPSKRPPPPKKPQKLRNAKLPGNQKNDSEQHPEPPSTSELSFPTDSGILTPSTSESVFEANPSNETEATPKNALLHPSIPAESDSQVYDSRNVEPDEDSREFPIQPRLTRKPVPRKYPPQQLPPDDRSDQIIIENSEFCELPKHNESMVDDIKDLEWDFKLPVLPFPTILRPGVGEGNGGFSLRDLVGAIQNGVDDRIVAEYLAYYDSNVVRKHLCSTLEGFPSIFFAVATNNELLLRKWVEFGADVSAIHESSGVPLLAFAIMSSEQLDNDTTLIVSTLLSLGAAPEVIPSSFYAPFIQDLPDDGPSDEQLNEDLKDKTKYWCTPAARTKLARTANITQRYYLERASKAKKPSSRHRQVAKLRNAEALLGISYFLIGQTIATNRLFQKFLNYMMVRTKRPLVMVFAGPSGHGKTELARRLGHLMSLDLEIVDCTIYNREIELFGGRNPYVGAEKGTPLNNFLVKNAGKRCIVFLDEFEKTTRDIHQALLVPFDNGEYQDRRDLKQIDCSKTVWILATNALDPTIQSFCKLHHKPIFEDDDDSEKLRLMKTLSKAIKEDFLSQFGSPVTGRISEFIPFLPFSPGEQAVIVHKFLLELDQKVRGPVNLEPGPKEQLLGNVRLKIRKDASVCRILAEAEYHTDLGARSLIMGARRLEDVLVEVYLEVDDEIRESGVMVDFVVDVNGSEVIAKMVRPKEAQYSLSIG